jgi:integrase
LYITALATGLRQGELLALRWEDVDLDSQRLRVCGTLARVAGKVVILEPKIDRSRRTIRLPEAAASALRAHRTRQLMERLVAGSRWVDSGHVFATTIGTGIEAAAVTRAFQRARIRDGLPHSRFHDLRHPAATFPLAEGFTLEDVMNLLGHSSIVLTSNTYGHVLERRQQQVAAGMEAVPRG